LIYEACITLIAAKEKEIEQKKNDLNYTSNPSENLPKKSKRTNNISLIKLLSQPDMKQLIVALAKELTLSSQKLKGKKKDNASLFFHFKDKQIGTD